MTDTDRHLRARHFVILLGWVSLFADLCYEGMRSAIGPYLALLGASGTAVGIVSGVGEALGYAIRYWSGALADRTQAYWLITIAGYSTNLLAVPLLALTGSWPAVAALVALERLGKGVRSPAKSTLTSFAATDLGAGKAFAINEAMDQAGALLGPLAVAGVLAWRGHTASGFAWSFVMLAIPATLSLLVLLRARRIYPDPRSLESETPDTGGKLGPSYRLYLVGVALVAIGLADWPLLAYHLEKAGVLGAAWLPIAYSAAMAVDGLVSLGAGLLFDRNRKHGGTGAAVLATFVIAGAAYGVLVFTGDLTIAIIGVALWALVHAATNSIGKAMIAAIVPRAQRGRAYGVYYVVFGVAWFAGSVLLGYLYDHSHLAAGALASSALVLGAGAVLWSGYRVKSA